MTVDSPQSPATHQAASDGELSSLLEEYLPRVRLAQGQVVRGTIVRVSPQAIVVDVGAKCEGVISGRELEQVDQEMNPGDEVMVYVVNPEDHCGEIVLSLARAKAAADWQQARSLMEKNETVELEVIAANRGGLIVRFRGLRGFVPASQLARCRRVPRISEPSCQDILQRLVGETIRVQVIEADVERNRLILSERAAEARSEMDRKAELLATLRAGDVRRGYVSNLTDFGAFVDLGGMDGLVHLSEMSWKRIAHPSDVLRVGQEVEVMVLNVDQERQRVALSIKRLEPDPWEMVGERYQIGQLVECCITRLTKWGAFACVIGDEAIEGLVHVSELTELPVGHPSDVVQPGQVLTLRVVRVEPESHRLALSLRQVGREEAAGRTLVA